MFPRPISGWLVALVLAGTALFVHAADPAEVAAARAEFFKAVAGDGGAVKTASAQFYALHGREPDHVLVRAYWGSCLALQGREAFMPWNKMRHTEDGLAQLDKALGRLTPEHDRELLDGASVGLETRLVAASTFLALPEMFRRFDAGKRLVEESLRHPAFASQPAAMQARFHYQASKVARKEDRRAHEIAALERTLAADAQGQDAAAARERLAALRTKRA